MEEREQGGNPDPEMLNYLAPEYLPNLKNKVEEP